MGWFLCNGNAGLNCPSESIVKVSLISRFTFTFTFMLIYIYATVNLSLKFKNVSEFCKEKLPWLFASMKEISHL